MPRATHCRRGHEFTPANTYVNPKAGTRKCRACVAVRYHREQATEQGWRFRNPEAYRVAVASYPERHPARRSDTVRRQRHGMPPERYAAVLDEQGGVCAICRRPETARGRGGRVMPLAVDHDHACCPGKTSCGACVRGLLCMSCNHGIGRLDDDPELLEAAAAYLRRTIRKLQIVGD